MSKSRWRRKTNMVKAFHWDGGSITEDNWGSEDACPRWLRKMIKAGDNAKSLAGLPKDAALKEHILIHAIKLPEDAVVHVVEGDKESLQGYDFSVEPGQYLVWDHDMWFVYDVKDFYRNFTQ